MTEIRTEYHGFNIRYSENDEVWRCWDLELQHTSLAKLKAKISAHERKARARAEHLEVWRMAAYSSSPPKRVWVASVDHQGGRAAIMVDPEPHGGDGKRERVKCDIADLVPITPETDAIAAEIVRLSAEQNAVSRKLNAVTKTLPRFDRASLIAAAPYVEGADD